MRTRYFSIQEIVSFLTNLELQDDLRNFTAIARCSIADFITICEDQKKGNIKFDPPTMAEKIDLFFRELVEIGQVHMAELDRETLFNTLFDHEKSEFWKDSILHNISPIHSVRRLSMKNNEWELWEDSVYFEMEDFFNRI